MSSKTDIKQMDLEYIANTYGRFDLVADRGDAVGLQDGDGKTYTDLGSGIGVNTFGFSDETWCGDVIAQISKLAHVSNYYYTGPQAQLAQLLCEKTGFKKVFFSNSGAEANECAIKCARKYSFDKYGRGRSTIITLENSFHGRTMATLSATGQEAMHNYFFPFLPDFVHVPANDIDALTGAADDSVCAVMLEPVQGEGGVVVLDPGYVKAVSKLCCERDILLIADEVQTGNGRTGTLYAYMQYGIMPDIMTTAKGLGGGLPLGATMFGDKTRHTMTAGTHGSTFGGNPVCAAGALSVLKRLDDEFLAKVRDKGGFIREQLQNARGVLSISGLGMMLGIETEKDSLEIVKRCMERGVIVLTAKNKVRLLPPLNIQEPELKAALDILKEVIGE